MRTLFLIVSLVALTACTPAASSPSASPSSATSVTPTANATSTPAATASPTAVPTSSATPIALPTVAFLAAAGNGVVWTLVGNSRLFRSRDRGDTWQERTTPAPPAPDTSSEIAFTSDTAGWVLRVASTPAACFQQVVEIYRTTDGAATWQKLATSGIGTTGCAQSLAFVDANTGYFTSWDLSGSSRVFRTTDGGTTWTASQPLPAPPGFSDAASANLRGGIVSDFSSSALVSVIGLGGNQQRAYVYRSADHGATWTFASQAPAALQGVTVITPTRWLQLVIAAQTNETTDGGASWHSYATDYQQAAPVAPQVVFGDASTGYASVRGSIQRTTDGGAHWAPVTTPGT